MFGDYVFEKSSAQYTDKILLLDDENLNSRANYISAFSAHGFEIVRYTDDLAFRIASQVICLYDFAGDAVSETPPGNAEGYG